MVRGRVGTWGFVIWCNMFCVVTRLAYLPIDLLSSSDCASPHLAFDLPFFTFLMTSPKKSGLCVCVWVLLFPRASTINEEVFDPFFLNILQNSFLSSCFNLSWACTRFNTMFFFRMYVQGNPSLHSACNVTFHAFNALVLLFGLLVDVDLDVNVDV